MRGAPIFDQNFPVGSIDRDRIINRYNSEGNNQTYFGTVPLGNPCQ